GKWLARRIRRATIKHAGCGEKTVDEISGLDIDFSSRWKVMSGLESRNGFLSRKAELAARPLAFGNLKKEKNQRFLQITHSRTGHGLLKGGDDFVHMVSPLSVIAKLIQLQ